MNIYPNAYYNYKKNRKGEYKEKKEKIKEKIKIIYHENKGVPGYRQMRAYLKKQGVELSNITIHKYMNKELGLKSITRRKSGKYKKAKVHKVFENLLNQNFESNEINKKWCVDFTYLYLEDGRKRYNCTIIDLYDRSVVASKTDKYMTSNLAIKTIQQAIKAQPQIKGKLILHSDQGSQYTSKEFVNFCEKTGITQSMSKIGCPYDNAPMERYFNTLKNELIYQYSYKTEEELYKAVEEFAYITYNHIRPHSYNGYKTPFEKRYAV